jgi:hypothetical protein
MLRLDTGPLTILIASLLAEPHGRGQLWTRKPATSPTWWPTFPGVDGFHKDNGVYEDQSWKQTLNDIGLRTEKAKHVAPSDPIYCRTLLVNAIHTTSLYKLLLCMH